MPAVDRSGSSLIMPSGYNTSDLEQAKFSITNGTVSVNTTGGAGGGGNPTSGTLTTLGTVGTIQNLAGGTIVTHGDFTEFSGSATGAGGTIMGTTDFSNYKWVSIQLFGTWVGTVALQVSNNNVGYSNSPVLSVTNTANALGTSMTANAVFVAPIQGRFYQIIAPSYTSGTIQAVVEAYTYAAQLHTMGVTASQSGGYNVAVTSAIGTLQSGTVIANGDFTGSNITGAAGTTVIKNAAGFLHSVTINTPIASDVITLYDNASGTSATTIGKVTLPATLVSEGPYTGLYDVKFVNGCVLGHTGTSDITVSYR